MFWNNRMYFSFMIELSVAAPIGASVYARCQGVAVAQAARSVFNETRAAPGLPVCNYASALMSRFSL